MICFNKFDGSCWTSDISIIFIKGIGRNYFWKMQQCDIKNERYKLTHFVSSSNKTSPTCFYFSFHTVCACHIFSVKLRPIQCVINFEQYYCCFPKVTVGHVYWKFKTNLSHTNHSLSCRLSIAMCWCAFTCHELCYQNSFSRIIQHYICLTMMLTGEGATTLGFSLGLSKKNWLKKA